MNSILKWAPLIGILAMTLSLGACAERHVTRVSAGQQIDLSGKWNDTDSQMVSSDMIKDALTYPWADDFKASHGGRKPQVMAFGVKNRTSEIINTQTFMKDLERAFLRSGRVGVVAGKDERSEIREERAAQQGFAANPAQIGKEVGADFVLTGTMNAISDRLEGTEVMYYQTNLELINVETNEKAWIGENKIKKVIERSGTKF